MSGSRTLASGAAPGGALGAWHRLSIEFADDGVAAALDGVRLAAVAGLRASTGAAALTSGWHRAHFDALQLAAAAAAPRAPQSWLYDVLPGEAARANLTGDAGFVLDLRTAAAPLVVAALGRFRARGNARAHELDLIDAATGASLLAARARLDLADCATDLLGFCYAALQAPATLQPGRVYLVVSSEEAGGDAFLAMDDAAAATTHVHRDGTTLMSYRGPGAGAVAGRAWREGAGPWQRDELVETMFGPLNLLLAAG